MRHRTWARGQARKRAARPSPEPLLPAEGRGGTAAMGKSNGQGGGAARSAQREDTAPQDVQHFPVAVGDRRSPNGRARSVWPNKGKGAFGLSKSPLRLDHAPARDLASPGLTVGKAGTDKSWTGLDSAIRKRLDLIRRET